MSNPVTSPPSSPFNPSPPPPSPTLPPLSLTKDRHYVWINGHPRIAKLDLKPDEWEARIIVEAAVVEAKLKAESEYAARFLLKDDRREIPPFKYLEAPSDYGNASLTTIGPYEVGIAYAIGRKETMEDACFIRRLEIIGEAVKNLPTSFKSKHPDIPWKKIAGMRDILIHEYFDVDLVLTWRVVKQEIPLIKKKLSTMISQ